MCIPSSPRSQTNTTWRIRLRRFSRKSAAQVSAQSAMGPEAQARYAGFLQGLEAPGRSVGRQPVCQRPAHNRTKSITPHISVWEKYERTDGMFSRLDFTYDAERDVYVCPNR